MVSPFIFVPHVSSLISLGKLHGSIRVMRPPSVSGGGATKLVFITENNYLLQISFTTDEVEFKFEMFCIEAKELLPIPKIDQFIELTKIEEWDQIKCLFRFEWERPALPGEVPENYEQIAHFRGKREDVSEFVSSIGISMIGLAFWNTIDRKPVALILDDDNDIPMIFRIYQDNELMTEMLHECECVDLGSLELWKNELENWFKDRNSSPCSNAISCFK